MKGSANSGNEIEEECFITIISPNLISSERTLYFSLLSIALDENQLSFCNTSAIK